MRTRMERKRPCRTRGARGRGVSSVGCKEPTVALGDDEAKRVTVEGAAAVGQERRFWGREAQEPACWVAHLGGS